MTFFENIHRPLFWSAIGVALIVGIHLILVYMTHDAVIHPDVGGTVTVGLVGTPPSLNPAKYATDPVNDLVLRYLFRSLLRYNGDSGEMVGDLAECDLGHDYSLIKCSIKPDNTWSDGSPITKKDILDTYAFLHDYSGNRSMQAILSQIDITDKGDYIEFHSHNADVRLLDIFTLPIMRSDMIPFVDTSGGIPLAHYVSSGHYTLTASLPDQVNSKNITLLRNEHEDKDSTVYVGRYVFRFFADRTILAQNEDILNIVYGQDTITPKSPRFARYDYLLPQYISLFLNSEKIPVDMRGLILSELSTTDFPMLDVHAGAIVKNVFFGDQVGVVTLDKKSPAEILRNLGYYDENGLIQTFSQEADKGIQPQIIQKSLPTNVYVQSPTKQKTFIFSGALSDGFTVSGTVPANTSAVYVGEYQLSQFHTGDTTFSYRVQDSVGNIHTGENTYVVGFEQDDGTRLAEEKLTVFAINDPMQATAKAKELASAATFEKALPSSAINSVEEKKKKLIDQVQKLPQPYYYNHDLKPYTLHILYAAQSGTMQDLANRIADTLKLMGIQTVVSMADTAQMTKIIENGDKNYDMILTGINLWLLDYNIFPYFHSGQAKVGFNFSRLRNPALDVELEKLKLGQLSPDELRVAKDNILKILATENVVRTFYSPYQHIYVDRNIINSRHTSILSSSAYIFDMFEHSYIKKHMSIRFDNKGIISFVHWVMSDGR